MIPADAWLTIGQSPMRGKGDSPESPTTDPVLCKEWDEDGSIDQLADPGVAGGGYTAQTGSCLPAFANAFTAATGRPSIFIRGAIGGTSLLLSNSSSNGTWDVDPGIYPHRFDNAVNRYLAAEPDIAAAGYTIERLNLLLAQGEQDANVGLDLDLYQPAFEALVPRFRAALGWPTLKIFVCRTGTTNSEGPGWQIVRDAQDAACAKDIGLVMAYTRTIDFFDLGWMKDDHIHYTQPGLNDWGTTAGTLAAAVLAGEEPPPPPPLVAPRSSRVFRVLTGI